MIERLLLQSFFIVLFKVLKAYPFIMSFIENIRQNLNANANGFFKAILLEEGVYIQGVISIKNFSTDEIIASLKKGSIQIVGEGLFIKKYCEGDLVICGKVKSLIKN